MSAPRPDPAGGCRECRFRGKVLSGGTHLKCELLGVWTNLLDPRFEGECLDPERKAGKSDETEPEQLRLF